MEDLPEDLEALEVPPRYPGSTPYVSLIARAMLAAGIAGIF